MLFSILFNVFKFRCDSNFQLTALLEFEKTTPSGRKRSRSRERSRDRKKIKRNEQEKIDVHSETINGLQFEVDSDGFVVVYTDGSCFKNGQADACAGYGVYFGDNHIL